MKGKPSRGAGRSAVAGDRKRAVLGVAALCVASALVFLAMRRREAEAIHSGVSVLPRSPSSGPTSSNRAATPAPKGGRDSTPEVASDEARLGVREVALAASTAVREALEDEHRFPELARCRREHRDCSTLVLAALELALSYPTRPGIGEGLFGIRELEARIGPRQLAFALHQNAVDAIVRSRDPVERVTDLALLERAEAPLPPLPAEATARLAALPAVEQRLVLGELSNSPSTDRETLEAVERLAGGGTPSVRFEAIRALGASRSADALGRVLANGEPADAVSRAALAGHVTPALVSCGNACGPVMLSLLEHGSPPMQLAALSAIASLSPEARTPVARDALRLVARAAATPSVQRQLDYLEQLAGS